MKKTIRRRKRRRMAYIKRVGVIRFAPARESEYPFCAYHRPDGEICTETTTLVVVGTLPSHPPITYMACPLHYDDVYQRVQAFLIALTPHSQQI